MSDRERVNGAKCHAEELLVDEDCSFSGHVETWKMLRDVCAIATRQADYIEATIAAVREMGLKGMAAKFEEIAEQFGVDL